MSDRLELQFKLSCPRDHAFRTFTGKIDLWWPRGHRSRPDATMHFEPGRSGRLIERSGEGERTIGDVVDWSPPERISFNWWLGAERHPTHVEIAFVETPPGTEVQIVHTPGLAATDDIWRTRVGRFDNGWTASLTALAAFIAAEEDT